MSAMCFIWLLFNGAEMLSSFYNATGNYKSALNQEGRYNYATSEYEKAEFIKAEEIFVKNRESIDREDLRFRMFHNHGNTFFKIAESKIENREKIDFLKKARDSYVEALSMTIDEETQKNLEYTEYMLEKIRRESEPKSENSKNKKDQESNQESHDSDKRKGESGENGDKQDIQAKEEEGKTEEDPNGEVGGVSEEEESENKKSESTGSESSGDGEDGRDGSGDSPEKTDEQNELSEISDDGKDVARQTNADGSNPDSLNQETRKALDEHAKKLQEDQEDIGKYYNKNYSENKDPFEEFNNFFSGDSMFDNSRLGEKSGEKDW